MSWGWIDLRLGPYLWNERAELARSLISNFDNIGKRRVVPSHHGRPACELWPSPIVWRLRILFQRRRNLATPFDLDCGAARASLSLAASETLPLPEATVRLSPALLASRSLVTLALQSIRLVRFLVREQMRAHTGLDVLSEVAECGLPAPRQLLPAQIFGLSHIGGEVHNDFGQFDGLFQFLTRHFDGALLHQMPLRSTQPGPARRAYERARRAFAVPWAGGLG